MEYSRGGGFASWNIIQSYYAFYEYLATICVAIDSATKADGHKVIAKAFQQSCNWQGRWPRLVHYPFNLTSSTSTFPDHQNTVSSTTLPTRERSAAASMSWSTNLWRRTDC